MIITNKNSGFERAVKEVMVRSSRKEASRKRKERKSKKAKNGDSGSTTSEQSEKASENRDRDPEKAQKVEPFETLENITKVAMEMKHSPPAKRVFLGIMGWKQAERTLIDSGKRIGLYFKFENIKSIDVLEEALPLFVIFCPYGSDAFTHYRIVHRIVNERDEYLAEDGSAEALTFMSLNGVASHYEKISDGTFLVI